MFVQYVIWLYYFQVRLGVLFLFYCEYCIASMMFFSSFPSGIYLAKRCVDVRV